MKDCEETLKDDIKLKEFYIFQRIFFFYLLIDSLKYFRLMEVYKKNINSVKTHKKLKSSDMETLLNQMKIARKNLNKISKRK